MYQFFKPGNEILLWYDARKSPEEDELSKSRENVSHRQNERKRKKWKEEVDSLCDELKDKHSQKYIPKLRLWARMMASGLHDSTNDPPAIPPFQNIAPKRRRSTLGAALTDAAEAIVKCMNQQPSTDLVGVSNCSPVPTTVLTSVDSVGISPGKASDLRMKNFEQLRYL